MFDFITGVKSFFKIGEKETKMAKGMDGDETQGREPMESEANKGYSVMMPRDAAVRGVVEI